MNNLGENLFYHYFALSLCLFYIYSFLSPAPKKGALLLMEQQTNSS